MSVSFFRGLRALARPGALSRREVLASTGAALALSQAATASDPKPLAKGKKILVIGGGFAGLSCAEELAHAGHAVTVVEARDYIGGRVKTRTDLVKGKTVEAGGELVGPNQPVWMHYKQRFGFKTVPMTESGTNVIELDGKVLGVKASEKLHADMMQAFTKLNELAKSIPAYTPWTDKNAIELDSQSLRDWIDAQPVPPDVKKCMAVQFTAINGIVPAWQSLLAVLAIIKGAGVEKFWSETDTLHIVGGCQQLAFKLLESIKVKGGTVKLNTAVRAVQLGKNEAVVVTQDLAAPEAPWLHTPVDVVVLTAPPSVWNKIDFTPSLPPGLTTPLADNIKFLGVTKGKPWKNAGRLVNALSNGPVQLTWETTAGQGEGGQHAIVAISGGPAADECRAWAKEGKTNKKYIAALEHFWPGYEKVFEDGHLYDWLSDPYSRGSYSFPAPGQVMIAGRLLDKGIDGRLYFAGEHCCYAFTGWMEAALASGVRLARRLTTGRHPGNEVVLPLAK